MDYKIIYSKRKTISLKLCKDGSVEVRAPFGVPRTVTDRFVSKHEKWINSRRVTIDKQNREFEALDTEALRRLAKEYIPPRVEHYAKIMGLRYSGIKITSAKGRFGSCSAKNSLCFSLYLLTYPKEAIDYVIVHELAHIREKNHSPAFHAVVASVLPDHKERRALLKSGVL